MKLLTIVTMMLALLLSACATTGNPQDPLEPMNRKVFAFNDAVDTYAFKPVAKGYAAVTPMPVRTGIGNFFSNLEDAWIGTNNLLQGKPGAAASDVGRLLVNTTVGILGLFDVATELGLEKHDEDLGQTLGVWGVGPGPYLVLPFFGSSTLRDSSNTLVTLAVPYVDPVGAVDRVAIRNTARAIRLVDLRAQLLAAGNALDEAALDKYSFMRDFYLKRRINQIYDGNPPKVKNKEDDDYLDEPAPPAAPAATKLEEPPAGQFAPAESSGK
ncbi:MlaA family lipoprotein [Uliginosibacterium gangwonense]|uniref:MlaA family lipoprotein n=1 Tax=Uliginosibacterium gangwonense TaxID=392736 RepID=UPI00038269A8|nr:VacJ family lipoprotein [Uliginosibacterium gangwonense]